MKSSTALKRYRVPGTRHGFLFSLLAALLPCPVFAAQTNAPSARLVVVSGAAGEKSFGEMFANWSMRLKEAAEPAGVEFTLVGQGADAVNSDLDELRLALEAAPKTSTEPLWLVLIGHGTFDGKLAKLNLRGPDLSANDLAEWLKPFKRPLAIINCTSCSAPFLDRLKGPERIVISATKSGSEKNFARFGSYFTSGIGDVAADLDKDGQVSLLEAFLKAAKDAQSYYLEQGRLATEHALLDDNGDGLGSRAEWFRGVRAVKKANGNAEIDGLRAHQLHLVRSELEKRFTPEQRAERDRLEMALNRHRERKQRLKEDVYYAQLESIVIQIAKIYEQVETGAKGKDTGNEETTAN